MSVSKRTSLSREILRLIYETGPGKRSIQADPGVTSKMRLGIVLRHIKRRIVNGHMHRGKDRLIKPVFPEDVQKMKNNLKIEEQNMFYLRHAYLTPVSIINPLKLIIRYPEFKLY